MKKVAFLIQIMTCGGIERALVNLCNKLIEPGKCEITIYMMTRRGEFLDKIPEGVEIKEIDIPNKIKKYLPVGGAKVAIRERLKQRKYYQAFVILMRQIFSKHKFAELNIDFEQVPPIREKYDIAINFNMHSPFLVRFLAEKVVAEKKYTWIHNDFVTTGYNIAVLNKYLQCNDGFFAVSKQLQDEFINLLPEYRAKIKIAHNLIDRENILQQSKEFVPQEYTSCPKGYIKILTVGRLEEQKGYDIAIKVSSRLKSDGVMFRWFVIGSGTESPNLYRMVREYGVTEDFIFLGVRSNPYPYFKDCDIYVQSSRHEGYATTITEAKFFCKPIVMTDVAGAREQIEDGVTGQITTVSEEALYSSLKHLIADPDRQRKFIENLSETAYNEENSYLELFD